MRDMFRGGRLVGQSVRLLKAYPRLLLLALYSGLSIVLVLSSLYAGSYALLNQGNSIVGLFDNRVWPIVTFVAYILMMFISMLFTSALVSCTNDIFAGRPLSLRAGLRVALGNTWQTLKLAVVVSTVGLVLRAFEGRSRRMRRLALRLAGVAWRAATWMVVPVSVSERGGARGAVRRSGTLMRKRWGSAVVGAVGVPVASMVLVGIILVPALALAVQVSESLGVLVVIVGVGVYSALRSTLGGVFSSALYQYASTGRVPPGFDELALDGAVMVERKTPPEGTDKRTRKKK